MLRFKNILVQITSDEGPQHALGRATKVARKSGAALALVAGVEEFPWYTRLLAPGSAELSTLMAQRSAESLEGFAEPIRAEGINVRTHMLRGRLSLEVVREVLRGGHDLVVKDAEPRGGVLFPSRDMDLLRTCPCPVWLVKRPQPARPLERVLAAVALTPEEDADSPLAIEGYHSAAHANLDARILEFATSLAELEGAELHVLHAWSAPGEDLLRGDPRVRASMLDDYVESLHQEAQAALAAFLAAHPAEPGRRVEHLRKGHPAEVITRFVADERIDAVVMGTVVRIGLPGFLIGNTAETVLDRVSCSLFTVKPDGFVSPVTLPAQDRGSGAGENFATDEQV